MQQTFSRLATPFRLLTSEWQAYHWDMKDTAGFHWRPAFSLPRSNCSLPPPSPPLPPRGELARPFGRWSVRCYMKTMTRCFYWPWPSRQRRCPGSAVFSGCRPVATTITRQRDGYMTWTTTDHRTFTVQMATSLGGVCNWADYVRFRSSRRQHQPNNRPQSARRLGLDSPGSFTMGSPTMMRKGIPMKCSNGNADRGFFTWGR